jgi:hypothetical protein
LFKKPSGGATLLPGKRLFLFRWSGSNLVDRISGSGLLERLTDKPSQHPEKEQTADACGYVDQEFKNEMLS